MSKEIDASLKEIWEELKTLNKRVSLIEKKIGVKKEEKRTKPVYAKSAFIIYFNEIKQKVMEENKNSKMIDVSKIIKEKWKQLDKKDKKIYSDLASKDRERYKREMEELGENIDEINEKPE